MKMRTFLIAGGNSTLLVWDCSSVDKKAVIEENLGKAEQIGFISVPQKGITQLEMMGDELCINSAITLASLLSPKETFFASGVKKTISFFSKAGKSYITIDLPYQVKENMVLFNSIGYILVKAFTNPSPLLRKLAKEYDLPAFGMLLYRNKKMTPYVYVVATNSVIKETACGSGSIAINVLKDVVDVVQPTGEKIIVKRSGSTFTIGAKVKEVKYGKTKNV